MSVDFVSNQEVILAARQNLEPGPWDYLVGGSESETTMRRNRLGFDRLAFRPRVLVDVSDVNPAGSLLGHTLRIPVLIAPIGSVQAFDPAGAVAATRAAGTLGATTVGLPNRAGEENSSTSWCFSLSSRTRSSSSGTSGKSGALAKPICRMILAWPPRIQSQVVPFWPYQLSPARP